jgi:hypothetical protein
MKVQEALKAAKTVICEGIYSEDGMDGDDGERVLRIIDAALSDIEKCEPVEIVEPDYHHEAMGCGLEDRNVTDRYEAMHYGWECAVGRMLEQIPEGDLYTSPISKEWVGLTDKDIKGLPQPNYDITTAQYVKIIEAKLKQLNAAEKG